MWKCPKCAKKVDDEFEICWACGTSIDGDENPDFLDESNVGQNQPNQFTEHVAPESLVTLIKCSLPPEAHAIRVQLESEGIPVYLFDEFTITMDWLLSNAIGGVKVQVPEPYLQRAREIIGIVEDEEDELEDEAGEEGEEGEEGDDELGDDTDGAPADGIVDLNQSPPVNQDDRIVDKQEGEA